jgi:hypothetical protein
MNPPLAPEIIAHLADSYPHNHDYRIREGRLKPSWQLWKRARKIRKHYSPGSSSLLDLSSCKGFFLLDAVLRLGMNRTRGIDVHLPDVEASRAASTFLGLDDRVQIQQAHLHEIAAEVELGRERPFDTTLLINTYPYLFFGSRREEHHYASHAEIFSHLASLTAKGGHLVFSNRVEVDLCPGHIQERAMELGLVASCGEEQIRAAISVHFEIEQKGKLGKIPLWVLHRR